MIYAGRVGGVTRHFVADLVAEAHAATSVAALGQFVLERLAVIAPYDSAIFIPPSVESGEAPVFLNKESFRGLYMLTRERPAHYLPTVEKMKARAIAKGGVARDTECLRTVERDRTPFYADIIRPQRIREQLVAPPMLRGTPGGLIFVCRHGASSGFSDEAVSAMREILPAIALASAAVRSMYPYPPAAAATAQAAPVAEGAALPPREAAVAQLVADGMTNAEISQILGTSRHTVRNQLSRIFRRLGVSTRLELAIRLRR
jgi:DNA-binding CsgD family transcriptional regulator